MTKSKGEQADAANRAMTRCFKLLIIGAQSLILIVRPKSPPAELRLSLFLERRDAFLRIRQLETPHVRLGVQPVCATFGYWPSLIPAFRALDPQRHLCDPVFMPKALEEITKEAMDLPPRQRLALAEFLLESADAAADPEAEAAWDSELRDRIRAIDEGRVAGLAYTDVMRAAEGRLVP